MQKYQKLIAVSILCLIFTTLFLFGTKRDFPLIFKKDLLAHDESSNSVVAANITRKFFPPAVRVNPLVTEQGNWMEGPLWQHIPPLFAYVPYVFFKLDGQITVEVKRLAYAFLIWLGGVLFINLIYAYSKSLWGAIAATIAAIFWIRTPFTHELVTGYAFGVSDIVLAFTVILGLDGVLWYLHKEKAGRLEYPWWKLGVMAVFVALPIMAKNLLGAIPAAIFFISLLKDFKFSRKFWTTSSIFLAAIAVYYLPLYLSSPQTFKTEILVSFFHAANYEGWGRPFFYYVTNYLPQRYLFGWTWVFFAGIVFTITFLSWRYRQLTRIDKLLIGIPLLWFFWNLIAISLIESKIPNFIFQSYLFALFAICYSLLVFARQLVKLPNVTRLYEKALIPILIMSLLATGYEIVRFGLQFKVQRALAYNYQSEHERFYYLAEQMRDAGINQSDLVIINNPPNDCWERYYILFLTGAESKTSLEMYFNNVPLAEIQKKYQNVYFVDKNYAFQKFDLTSLPVVLTANQTQIENEIQRIKKDKTSCQWLVPDPILNAP